MCEHQILSAFGEIDIKINAYFAEGAMLESNNYSKQIAANKYCKRVIQQRI